MNIMHDINPERISPSDFIATIEITKGSKKKYELDKETGLLILDRILYSHMEIQLTIVILTLNSYHHIFLMKLETSLTSTSH